MNARDDYAVRAAYSTLVRQSDLKVGSILRASYQKEDLDFVQWIIEQTPKNSTLADLLIAIAWDAYQDEKETK